MSPTEPVPAPAQPAGGEAASANAQAAQTMLEQTIEQIGARYLADLRTLSDAFAHVYAAQLRTMEEELVDLRQRLERATQERNAFEARVHELLQAETKYASELQELSAGFGHLLPSSDDQATPSDATVKLKRSG